MPSASDRARFSSTLYLPPAVLKLCSRAANCLLLCAYVTEWSSTSPCFGSACSVRAVWKAALFSWPSVIRTMRIAMVVANDLEIKVRRTVVQIECCTVPSLRARPAVEVQISVNRSLNYS